MANSNCNNDIVTMKQVQEVTNDHSSSADDYEEDVDFPTRPCNKPRCKICDQIVEGDTVHEFNCKSKNVVYQIQEGGKTYVGKTKGPMSTRMNSHRHNIKVGRGDGPKFIEHFNPNNYANAEITVLDHANNRQDLTQKEHEWINRCNSYEGENGLNSRR